MGSGTSAVAAEILGRLWVGIELSPDYCEVARNRIKHFIEGQKQTELEIK
jgi:DNA modification methylase